LFRAKRLIEDYTCPFTGLPTPDKELSRVDRRAPLGQFKRSIWAVSAAGTAMRIIQEYQMKYPGPSYTKDSPLEIFNDTCRVDLYTEGSPLPESVVDIGAIVSDDPQGPTFRHYDVGYRYRGVVAVGWGGEPSHTSKLISPEPIAEQTLNALDNELFAWFVPIDLTKFSLYPPVENTSDGGTPLVFASSWGDNRIPIFPYKTSEEQSVKRDPFYQKFTLHNFAPDEVYSLDATHALEGLVSREAASMHSLLMENGAIDVYKLYPR